MSLFGCGRPRSSHKHIVKVLHPNFHFLLRPVSEAADRSMGNAVLQENKCQVRNTQIHDCLWALQVILTWTRGRLWVSLRKACLFSCLGYKDVMAFRLSLCFQTRRKMYTYWSPNATQRTRLLCISQRSIQSTSIPFKSPASKLSIIWQTSQGADWLITLLLQDASYGVISQWLVSLCSIVRLEVHKMYWKDSWLCLTGKHCCCQALLENWVALLWSWNKMMHVALKGFTSLWLSLTCILIRSQEN